MKTLQELNREYNKTNLPKAPLMRIMREGCTNICEHCGSTKSREHLLFGKWICHQPECEKRRKEK